MEGLGLPFPLARRPNSLFACLCLLTLLLPLFTDSLAASGFFLYSLFACLCLLTRCLFAYSVFACLCLLSPSLCGREQTRKCVVRGCLSV